VINGKCPVVLRGQREGCAKSQILMRLIIVIADPPASPGAITSLRDTSTVEVDFPSRDTRATGNRI